MKIQLASDLHLEMLQARWPDERLISPADAADVLVLAGDIHSGAKAVDAFEDWGTAPIIYVCGNHELYGHSVDSLHRNIRKRASGTNINFLETEAIVLGNVRFLGCTLWTDYRLGSMHSLGQVMDSAKWQMTDHSEIRRGKGTFTPQDALALHLAARQWLTDELAKPLERQ